MKLYRITFEPLKYTNDYPIKTVEIKCKKPNLRTLIWELYNKPINSIIKVNNNKYLADNIICIIEK